ncbi:hypothetical protein ACFE04_016691 [Oxalis oulophora]
MGSLESGSLTLKRDSLIRSTSSSSSTNKQRIGGSRSMRLSRFLLFKKLDYLQWICTIAVFLFFVVLFQMFLPGSVIDNNNNINNNIKSQQYDLYLLELLKKTTGDDDNIITTSIVEPFKLMNKFQKEDKDDSQITFSTSFNRTLQRFGYRKPLIALVFADLSVDPQQLLMVTVAIALRDVGYDLQVYSTEDGEAREAWQNIGIPVTITQINQKTELYVDCYDGILVSSLKAKEVLSGLVSEPFKNIPLIWTIHENTLANRSREYISRGQTNLVKEWKKVFNRATVVVFPNYVLPINYAMFDAGNYYVVPGSPAKAWEAHISNSLYKDNLRVKMGLETDDLVIAIVGSQFVYKSLWLEHALILEALLPLLANSSDDNGLSSHPHLKILVLSGESNSNYSVAIEAIASKLKYSRGAVKHIAVDFDSEDVLSTADLVIYGSFLQEKSFPEILIKAMCLGKPIIAPDLPNTRKYVDDKVNGYLFPKENMKVLTNITLQLISNGKLSPLAHNIASIARNSAKNILVSETIEGYISVLKNVIKLPSEVTSPKPIEELDPKLKKEWRWDLFESFNSLRYEERTLQSYDFLRKVEEQMNHTQKPNFSSKTPLDDSFEYDVWEEHKYAELLNSKKRKEDEELKDRTDQAHGTWEDVYRNAKRADRLRNVLHERDERELERTGQLLCIYEPYFGEGTWSFLHLNSLYRGIGLSTKGRRPGTDDIDAPSRLPLLNDPYYRDALGEYGAFFAISSRIDRIHKNSWIGFQSWRATASQASLSSTAEHTLVDAIQSKKHGDALFFWVRMDTDRRNTRRQDFWSFCDAINAGNCKFAFSETLKRMYGLKHGLDSLPPMPDDGDTWSVMQSWALPTRSFLEFVMFSRIFVDSLDAQMYDEHHRSGHCYLSLTKDKHCYSRLLELLVNVWAYHSARRMVYVNPETGTMQEQHKLKGRKGQMWIKWFQYSILKSMDEDLAEEADSDRPKRRWLWPSTGEVVWQGTIEREKNQRNKQKEKRKQQSKDKLDRMKKRSGRQKALGKFMKAPPEEIDNVSSMNSTVVER